MLELKHCPICGGSAFHPFLTCKDYTVSKKDFNIVSCSSCNFKFTNPRPADVELGDYYKSEDYISHSNTKKGLVSRVYHLVRNYTLRGKVKLISKYVSRGTILDYGCGIGMFLKTCKDAGWRTFGMEPDPGARSIASGMGVETAPDKQALAAQMENQKADIITLWHVLEHVTDIPETLGFFRDNLNEKGTLIVAVPNYTSYDARYYGQYWAAYDVPRHLYHFEVNTVSRLLSPYGFKLKECLPMKFDSFYVSMLSEKYRKGSINYFNAFIRGFISNVKAGKPENYSSVIYVFQKA